MNSSQTHDSPLAAMARLTWMAAGNVVLIIIALTIAIRPPWTFSWRDGAYAAAIVGLLAVRYLDITRLDGTTADGDPATLSHFGRWAVAVVALAGGAWFLSQSFAL